MHSIRAALVGVGAMNRVVAELLLARGVDIVGAVGRSSGKLGRDAGEVLGIGRTLGVTVTSDSAALYETVQPDIALVATTSFMTDQYDILATCARHGVNALTIAEELTYPWHTAPEETAGLDRIAREHGVTLAGGGFQDYFLVNQISGLIGTVNLLERLVGEESFNVDDYGPEVARDQRVGDTPEQFERWRSAAGRPPTFALPILAAIASASGLTINGYDIDLRPDVATVDTFSRSLDRVIRPGQLLGYTTVDTVTTVEGAVLSMEISGHIFAPDEADRCTWQVTGDPSLEVMNPGVDTLRTTCTQMVNRIPDILNAPAGFATAVDLPPLRYRPRPLCEYVRR